MYMPYGLHCQEIFSDRPLPQSRWEESKVNAKSPECCS